jgi:hypothetical protein
MTTYAHIPELFYHYLWKHKLLKTDLFTRSGKHISILHPGNHNTDAGPDFTFARLKIGDTVWAGSVEIHCRASDWYRHAHQKDDAYNNVILHVVAEDDRVVKQKGGQVLETLCLHNAFDMRILKNYREIVHNLLWIPCERLIKDVPAIKIRLQVHSMAVERLINRAKAIKGELIMLNNDWEELCFSLLSRQFGAKVNTDAFDMLANSVPARILMAHHDDLFQLEAILFGQSGLLLGHSRATYIKKLKREHKYQAAKYGLSPMPGYLWKFLRLRPASFPTLRIAQLAALYHKRQSIFTEIIEIRNTKGLLQLFDLSASEYWDTHYTFGKSSARKQKRFGRQSIHLLIINAIIPLLHLYGQEANKPELCERAIAFLEELPPESNAVIKRWSQAGIKCVNSLESQGLLQLKKRLCDHKLCLGCSIGHHILNRH